MHRLLDTLIQRKLWVSSLANAIGLTAGQMIRIIKGDIQPNDAVRHNLGRVLGGSWHDDISAPEEIPQHLLECMVRMTHHGIDIPEGVNLRVAVLTWLEHSQIFTLHALYDALQCKVSKKVLAQQLRRFGYHSKWERSGPRRHLVWRFNPYRFGLPEAGKKCRRPIEPTEPRNRIQPTGYILTKIDERGEVVLLDNGKYEVIQLVRDGHIQPRVFRSWRGQKAHPGHARVEWGRA